METRKTYGELFTKPTLTPLEETKVTEFESYIKFSKIYGPYISPGNQDIVNTYDREIKFLQGLQDTEKNPNIQERISVGETLMTIIPKDEQKRLENEEQKNKEQALQLKLDKRAGYMNASILIFVICNLGLFLATFLLMLK